MNTGGIAGAENSGLTAAPLRMSRKIIASMLCGGLFFLLYNVTNYLAARDGGSAAQLAWHASWELAIPVIPWLIVPYWSIDLLFVIAFLVCTSTQELRILSLRVCAAVCISSIIFWLFPLTLASERHENHGMWSPLFSLLYSFDKPHNLFPSMHVAFAVIMRWTLARHSRGWLRLCMHLWLALITISTICVHQHHLIDIIGGGILGILVLYFFDQKHLPTCGIVRNKRSWQLCAAYSILALVLYFLAVFFAFCGATSGGAWYLVLLWPALSFTCVAAAYAGLGSAICQSRSAGPSYPARFILFAWLEALGWWWWQIFPASHIIDDVWIGRIPDIKNWHGNIIDCTCEHRRRQPISGTYERVPMLDLALPNAAGLRYAAERIEHAHMNNAPVLVVCGLGLGRSALCIAAWLMVTQRVDNCQQAIAMVSAARPQARWSADALRTLQQLED